MYILAFDTTSNSLSIALNKDNTTLSEITISPSSNQSELLIPRIEEILKQNHIFYQDLSLIAATSGPGSFAGSRIGLTAARTIKLATKQPLILLNSCQVIAFKHQEKLNKHKQIFVTLDARANEIFYATYKSLEDINSIKVVPQITTTKNIRNLIPKEDFFLCGSANSIITPILQSNNFLHATENDVIEAKFIAQMAFKLYNTNYKAVDLNPLYLRSPRITKRKK